VSLCSLAAAGAVALFPSAASAGTITVINQNDDGPGSLRQAISDAGPGDTVAVPAGTYTLISSAPTSLRFKILPRLRH
jgi:hypothetical protein